MAFTSGPKIPASAAKFPATVTPGKPNIILILTDDLDAAALPKFPNISRLMIQQGASFPHFYVTNPWCCPSRSSILRSQYMHSHHVISNRAPTGGFEKFRDLESSTIGTWMKSAGYRTALFGKYLNQYPKGAAPTYIPPGWDEWAVPVTHLYREFDYQLNDNGTLVDHGREASDYLEDVLSAKADAFVHEPGPLFLYLAPTAPHQPANYAPRHAGDFASEQAPRTPSFNQDDLSREPQWLREKKPLSQHTIGALDQRQRNRLRAMLGVDDLVGNLFDTLAKTGKLADTYVFLTSDNGFHLGQHRLRAGKTTPFEEDIRVPLVVRGPGIAPGSTIPALSSTLDLAPTFAHLGGAVTGTFAEGRTLVPLLQGVPNLPWRHALLAEFAHPVYGTGRPPSYAVLRTGRFSYVEYDTGERQLYDLDADPYELRNLVSTANPALLAALSARLAELRACSGPSCRTADAAEIAANLSAESAVPGTATPAGDSWPNPVVPRMWRTGR
ncbi:sulfatase [Streptosporangiaceae bacterium NEAU-GS5]|nr:sulfatase [Streptosporangiaceae bacterium NEAU-GS5]